MKNEKLTLRLEKEAIEKAKRFAKEHETSVSKIVADFFDSLERPDDSGRYRPITTRLRGAIKPENDDLSADEGDYLRYLEEKHG